MHKVIRSTPVYQVLGDFSSAPPLFAQGQLNKQALVALPGLVSYFYKVKADYRSLIANIVAAALNRPMNSWESREGIRRNKLVTVVNPEMEWQASEKPLFPKYHDLQMYKQVYNPPDPNFCAAEQGDCLKLLDLAKSANIEVIVVDMPVTRRNQLLIDRLYAEKYKKFVDYLEKNKNVKVVRLFNDPYITDEDFEDSAHMNASGGRKLFSRLCAAILSEVNSGEIVLSR